MKTLVIIFIFSELFSIIEKCGYYSGCYKNPNCNAPNNTTGIYVVCKVISVIFEIIWKSSAVVIIIWFTHNAFNLVVK